jgi:type IV secretory pathway VirJ component
MHRPLLAVALACAFARALHATEPPPWQAAVDALDLPLTVVPATTTPRALLVLMTGDGGWAAVDQAVAGGLAARGVTTLGWSSLRYFATTQPVERVATDLGRLVDALAPARLPVYLGGYSFGAEVVPVAIARCWSPAERARVHGLLLLAPSASATFRVDPLDWVRDPPIDPANRVDDAVRRLAPLRVLCVTGVDDATCICGTLTGVAGVEVARVPGTHHFENGIPDVVGAATSRLFFREAR